MTGPSLKTALPGPKALAIIGPSSAGWDRFSSTCVSETTVPMMPMVGA